VFVTRSSKLYYTASGIIRPIGGSPVSQPVHGTATYRSDDTRGCIIQFWSPDDEDMCSKHVEAWNKLIVKQKFCASSWLITKINILKCTVSRTSKLQILLFKITMDVPLYRCPPGLASLILNYERQTILRVCAHTFPAVIRLALAPATQFYANTPVKFNAPKWVTLACYKINDFLYIARSAWPSEYRNLNLVLIN